MPLALPDASVRAPQKAGPAPARPGEPPAFEAVYDACFDVVWRNLRRLGVPDAQLEDAVQDVFLVVHRRLPEFVERSPLKAWVCAIVTRVASDHRRALRRKSPHARSPDAAVEADTIPDERPDPEGRAEQVEGGRLLHRVLDELSDDKREVLVLAELEELTVPEIADALGENVNTIYARLRAARHDFDVAAQRARAKDTWRLG